MAMSDSIHHYYLQQMGVDVWVARAPSKHAQEAGLIAHRSACSLCSPHQSTAVCSRGNLPAKLMIIGMAPSEEDEIQGLLFAGKAGNLLNNMLKSIGLSHDEVYMTTLLKCRSPKNELPQANETSVCIDDLIQQVNLVSPQLILALGEDVVQSMLGLTSPLRTITQHTYEFQGIPVHVSSHPEYLLNKPKIKKQVYQDLLQLQTRLSH